MLNLLPCRLMIRLPREKNDLDVLSCFSSPAVEPDRSSCERSDDASREVIDDAGDWRLDIREVVVDVVVLLLDRPLKTESRRGLCDCALDRERVCHECSRASLAAIVAGLCSWSESSCHAPAVNLGTDDDDDVDVG